MTAHWSPGSVDLPASGVTPGVYGDGTHVGQVTVDAEGRVTAAADVAITGGGGITDLTSTGSTITVTTPTGPTTNVDLPASGVTAGTYGDATHSARVTIDAEGRVTAAASVAITGGGGGGSQLDYVTRATDLPVTATSAATAQAFIDGNAVTYDGATRIELEVWTPNISSSLGACILELFDGATDLGRLIQSNEAGGFPAIGKVFLTPSAGSHTYHVKAWRSDGGSTAQVTGSSGGVFLPAFYRITTA